MEFAHDISTSWILIFILTGFIAGYIDSIAGGGGMITIPMLLFSGIPPIFVLGTNKLQSVVGALMATIKYAMNKKISWKIVSVAILPCLVASYFGSQLIMFLSDVFIQWAILVSIPFAFL
ncbi:MAG: putative membrane protein YfcA, partial [Sulfurimonas sp.]